METRVVRIDGQDVPDVKVSDHFWLSDFRVYWPKRVCKHDRFPVVCQDVDAATALANSLEVLREKLRKPIIITDCLRPTWLVRYIPDSARNSRHLTKWISKRIMAVDFKVPGVSMKRVYKVADELMSEPTMRYGIGRPTRMGEGGLGYYRSHIHYDNRGYRARWGLK